MLNFERPKFFVFLRDLDELECVTCDVALLFDESIGNWQFTFELKFAYLKCILLRHINLGSRLM